MDVGPQGEPGADVLLLRRARRLVQQDVTVLPVPTVVPRGVHRVSAVPAAQRRLELRRGLLRSEGFQDVGRLPKAFRHPERGDIDALVMFRQL